MSKKNLCLVIPSLVVGGMERIMSEIGNYMVKKDINVWLLLMFRDEMFYNLDPRIQIIMPSRNMRFKFIYAFYLFPYIRLNIRKVNPDAILSFGERYNSYVLLATLGLNFPIFISDRSSPNKYISKLNLWLSKVLYQKAAGIIAQTSKAAELLHDRLNGSYDNIKVIPNPLREIVIRDQLKKNQIVALGRMVREKRYDRLLDVMSKLSNKTWNLIIVGDGSLRQQIELQIKKNKLNDRVQLVGQRKDVDRFLEESRIFVLTSDIEGYPNALCEAMAFGLACLSFDCVAGPGDIIRNGENGILVEEGNIERFAKELDILIADDQKRKSLGEEAEKIKIELHGEKIFEQYLDFIFSKEIYPNS